jgi:hypothetical protein
VGLICEQQLGCHWNWLSYVKRTYFVQIINVGCQERKGIASQLHVRDIGRGFGGAAKINSLAGTLGLFIIRRMVSKAALNDLHLLSPYSPRSCF